MFDMLKYHFKKNSQRKGSMIIESMIAISLVVVGLVGIFNLVTRSTHMNKDVENRVVATYLAAEGIEVIKNIIDTNVERTYRTDSATWNEGLSGWFEIEYDTKLDTLPSSLASTSTTPLRLNKTTGRYSYDGSLTTPYYRTVKVGASGDVITVDSFVEWTADGRKYTVHLSDVFQNWRERSTPQYNPQ